MSKQKLSVKERCLPLYTLCNVPENNLPSRLLVYYNRFVSRSLLFRLTFHLQSADQDISMETTTVESQLLASSAHASLHPSARRTNYRPNHGRPNHTRPTPISIPSAEERRADYTHVGQNNSSIRNNSMSPLLAGAEAQSSSAVDSSSVSTGSHVQHRMIPISSALRRPIEVVASAGENRAAATMGDARQTLTLEGASPRYHSSQMAAFAMRSGSRALDVLYGEATDNDGAAPADPEIRGPRDNEMVEEGGAAEHPGGGVARSGFATTSASNRTIATSSQAESERDEDVHSVERRISVSQTVISQTPLPSVPGQRVFGAFVRMLPAGTEPSGYPRQRPAGADQARGRVNTNTAESTRNHLVIRSSRHLESRIPRLGIQVNHYREECHLPRLEPSPPHNMTIYIYFTMSDDSQVFIDWMMDP